MKLKRALYSNTSDAYCSISNGPLSLFFELPHPLTLSPFFPRAPPPPPLPPSLPLEPQPTSLCSGSCGAGADATPWRHWGRVHVGLSPIPHSTNGFQDSLEFLESIEALRNNHNHNSLKINDYT